MANQIIIPLPGPRTGAGDLKLSPATAARVRAKLTSLDSDLSITFEIPPSEHDRNFGANWEDAGVAQASVQFSEYKDSIPEERSYRVVFDAYRRPGGLSNNIEGEYEKLKRMTLRAPNKIRAHKLLYSQGAQSFKCVLIKVGMPVRRIARDGGALQSIETTITLKEIP